MNNLPKFALAFQGVPANKEEDYLSVYGSTTRWSEDGKRILEYNWGRCSTIYIAHQFKEVPVYYDDLTDPEKAGQQTGEKKEVCRAMAITVPNPITREKLFQQGLHVIYEINGYEEQLDFTQKMLNESIDNPNSEEVKTYKEVSSWLNWELDKWEGITVESAKEHVLSEIDAYDTSDNVNSFYLEIGGEKYQWWLSKSDRVGLMNSTTIQKETQEMQKVVNPISTLWYNSVSLTLPCDAIIAMLGQLEIYSLDSFNVTARHKAAVSSLDSVEDILNYDYTEGYPEKLTFTIPTTSEIQG